MKKLAILLSAAALVFSFFVYLFWVNGEAAAKNENASPARKDAELPNGTVPEVSVQTDKDFGYFVGDTVAVKYEIKMPVKGWRISLKDLPREGQIVGQGVKIWEIRTRWTDKDGHALVMLEIKFQIFRAFNQPRNLPLPAIAFFSGPEENPRRLKSNLPRVPVKISPLCGDDEPLFQPFFEPFIRSNQKFLAATFGGGILMLAGWLWLLKIFIYLRRHPSPFKEAIGKIKKIKPDDYREILLVFRHSINQRAGQAIFGHNLDELFRIIPRARKRSEEISKIIALCDNLHFNPNFQPDPKTLFGLKNRLVLELKYLARSERWK